MTLTQPIRNLSLTLYPCHVRDDFDRGYQQQADNAKDLWQNLATVWQEFNSEKAKEEGNKLIELDPQDGQTITIPSFESANDPNLTISLSLTRLHDTYAADLTLDYQGDTDDLSKFKPKCLLPERISASLGQTFLLYGYPVNTLYKDYRTFADSLVQNFVQDNVQTAPQWINEGRLFGIPIFEYDNGEENPAKRCHILVWLKHHPQPVKQITEDFNYGLMNLLCYRRKMIFAYYKSRTWYQAAQRLAINIEKEIPVFKQIEDETEPEIRLNKLKGLLNRVSTNSFEYTKCLRYLKEIHNTVTTNTENYGKALGKISKLSLETDNLEFWEKFIKLSKNKFQSQIQVDLNYLTASQDLFKEMIDTIRGMVEILAEEQAQVREKEDKERDRNLQTTIAVVGVGIGLTGLVASSFPYLIPQDPTTTPIPLQPPFTSNSLHPFLLVLIVSLVFGVAGAGIAKVVTMLTQSRINKRAKLKNHANNKLLNQANTPVAGKMTGVAQKEELPIQSKQK